MGKILANHLSAKRLLAELCEELHSETNNLIKRWTAYLDTSPEEVTQIVSATKRCVIPLVIMEMQVKTRYYFTRIAISKIKVLVRIWRSWNACALLVWISW